MALQVLRTIRASGGDYTSITAWNNDFNPTTSTNLTTSLAFNCTINDDSFVSGETVTGSISGATGEVVGKVTNGTILIRSISPTPFQISDIVTGTTGSVTLTGSGDNPLPVAECYDDWPGGLDDHIALAFISDWDSYPTVTVSPGHRHNLIQNSGFRLNGLTTPTFKPTYDSNDYPTVVEYIYSEGLASQFVVGTNTKLVNCFAASWGNSFEAIDAGSTLINCLSLDISGSRQISGYVIQNADVRLFNCGAIDNQTSYFAVLTGGSSNLINCYSTNARVQDYFGTYTNVENSNNLSSDATAPGANPVINTTLLFNNPGSGDYHLSINDTTAAGGGTDLSLHPLHPFDFDVDEETRVSPWSIGPDQFQVVLPTGGGGGEVQAAIGEGVAWTDVEGEGGFSLTGVITGEGEILVDKARGDGHNAESQDSWKVSGSGTGTITGDGLGGTTLTGALTGDGVGSTPVYASGGKLLGELVSGITTGGGGLVLRSNVFGDHQVDYVDLSGLNTITDSSVTASNYISTPVMPYIRGTKYFCGIFVKKEVVATYNSLLRISFLSQSSASTRDFHLNPQSGSHIVPPTSGTLTDIGDYWFIWMEVASFLPAYNMFKLEFYPAYGSTLGNNDITTTGATTVWGMTISPIDEAQYNSKVEQGCFRCAELITNDYLLTDDNGTYIVDHNGDNIKVTKRSRWVGNATKLGEYNRTQRGHPMTEFI